jgi:hypothetical protein
VAKQLLWCIDCGDVLSPVKWLLDEAMKNHNLWDQRNSLRKQIGALSGELEDLKRQVRNAKAQLKRARSKR